VHGRAHPAALLEDSAGGGTASASQPVRILRGMDEQLGQPQATPTGQRQHRHAESGNLRSGPRTQASPRGPVCKCLCVCPCCPCVCACLLLFDVHVVCVCGFLSLSFCILFRAHASACVPVCARACLRLRHRAEIGCPGRWLGAALCLRSATITLCVCLSGDLAPPQNFSGEVAQSELRSIPLSFSRT
jgi:hypothetical protein